MDSVSIVVSVTSIKVASALETGGVLNAENVVTIRINAPPN